MPKRKKDGTLTGRDQATIQVTAIMGWTRIGLSSIRWAGVVVVVFFAYKSIQVLAGQATFAKFVVEFVGKLGVSQWLAWLIAVLATGYGLGQRKLRHRAIGRPDSRIKELKELEASFDPRRSSSHLDEHGRTPPGA